MVAILALVASAVSASAGEGEDTLSAAWTDELPASGLNESGDVIRLSLADAVQVAVRRNLGLQVQRIDRTQSHLGIMQNEGIYDFFTRANLLWGEEESAAASNLSGASVLSQDTGVLNLGVSRLIPSGGTASIDWNNRRSESNSFFASVNPSFTSDFDLAFSQPLLRNFGRIATERALIIARTNSDMAFHQLEASVIDLVDRVENAYWSLVETRAQLEVSRESLALAEELHEKNRTQVEVGTLAPLELIQSEVGVATRREEIIRAEGTVGDAEDELRRLMNLETDSFWDRTIEPTTDPETARIDVDLANAIRVAYEERAELEQQRLFNENLELDAKFFRRQMLPQLTLDLRYGWNGLGGDVRQLEPGEDPFNPNARTRLIPGGFGDAVDQILDQEFVGWQAGLNFGFPIQNRQARASSQIADLELEQGRITLSDLELSIRTEVRQAARGVRTAAEQIDSATTSQRLAERNLDAERKRYENGLSTSFQILEIQEDLSQARSRLVTAVTSYRRALVRYYRALGRLLDENGIELEDLP